MAAQGKNRKFRTAFELKLSSSPVCFVSMDEDRSSIGFRESGELARRD